MSDDLLGMLNALDRGDKSRETYVRAPFGYPGGKGRSLEHILPNLPYRSTYVEVFGGSGAVLLARNTWGLEVFNDRFSGVTCFYRVIRDPDGWRALQERLELTIHSREEFLWCKETWKDCQDELERAARWWYMVTASFTQQGRSFGRDLRGRPGVPMRMKNNLALFEGVHRRLRYVQIENLDWRQCLKDYDSGETTFYLDPPYYTASAGVYEHELTKAEHVELLERIFQLKGFVALSGYPNELYDRYPWDARHTWKVHDSMNALAFTETNHKKDLEGRVQRGYATEVLWVKEAES